MVAGSYITHNAVLLVVQCFSVFTISHFLFNFHSNITIDTIVILSITNQSIKVSAVVQLHCILRL